MAGGALVRPLAVALLVGLPWCAGGAGAATLQCLPRALAMERLEAAAGERPVHAGLVSNGALLEVTVSPEGSWTALLSFPDGLTCPIAAGEAWRSAPGAPAEPPEARS